MRRNGCPWPRLRTAAAVALLTLLRPVATAAPPVDPPPPAPTPGPGDAPPIHVFLKGPDDLTSFWKSLKRPDFVILRGDEYDALRKPDRQAGGPAAAAAAAPAVVASVAVEGAVRGDLAELTLSADVVLNGDGPAWVPLRLDGLSLTGAREGERDLPLTTATGGAWQVELKGAGRHAVRVGLLAPVRITAEGRRLDLAIPEAASTRLTLDVPQRVLDAQAGANEPVAHATKPGSAGRRLTAALPPRPRLTVTWRVDDESGAALPPLLVAQGEIGVDVEPGSLRTRSSWAVRSVRGTARSLQFTLDRDDEVLDLELDGQKPPTGLERVEGGVRLNIPLTDPLGPGQERKLVMTTRRAVPPGGAGRLRFQGFPLTSAREQSGAIGVSQGGDYWVSGVAGRGVRPIDPRNELPTDLRERPGTVRAYQFSEQPFELTLGVEPSPPLPRAEGRTTLVLEPGSARVDSWFEYQAARGRLFELTLGLPPGFEVESVGPEDVVGSWQTGTLPTGAPTGGLSLDLRLLTVRLGPRVQDGSRFMLHVAGRQAVGTGRSVAVALVQPVGAIAAGGRVAVLADPSLTVELADPAAGAAALGSFRQAAQAPPADWPWPAGRAAAEAPALWLRYDDSPTRLPLTLTAHPMALAASTALQVRVDRRGVDVRQETECDVRFGTLDHLDVVVPPALDGLWEVEGPGVASRVELGRNRAGERTERLNLETPLTRSFRLTLRYRLPVPRGIGPDRPARVEVPWVRVAATPGEPAPVTATVLADPGLTAAPEGPGWEAAAEPAPGDPTDSSTAGLERTACTRAADGPGVLGLKVAARAMVELPTRVVPRLALRSAQTAEGAVRTTAWFAVETAESDLVAVLPPGAVLQRARVAGAEVLQVEQLAAGGYRVSLPSRPAPGPVPVELSYEVPAGQSGRSWQAPRLDGTLVQRTLWEVRLPWSRAVVGVPAGWSDENDWYWDRYVWKRRPWKPPGELEAWATGAAPPADDALARGDDHSYLFGQAGPPPALGVTVVSRAWLVGVCSGAVLALGGFLILVWAPPVRLVWAAALPLALAAAAVWHPSVAVLVTQSAVIGLLLTALVGLMHRVVERRRRRAAGPRPDVTPARGEPAVGSTLSRTFGAGSDDSTAVRVRPPAPIQASTMDYVATATPAAEPPPAPAAAGEPGGFGP